VSIVFIDELRPAGIWNCPGYRERIKACAIGVVGAFTFERRKGVHEGDSDVGKDSATARGNLILGERRDERKTVVLVAERNGSRLRTRSAAGSFMGW
jgi:hypothetical protein